MNLTPKYIASNVRFTFCLSFGCCTRMYNTWNICIFSVFFPASLFHLCDVALFRSSPNRSKPNRMFPFELLMLVVSYVIFHTYTHTHAHNTHKRGEQKIEKIKFPACICFALSHDLMIGTMQFTWWNDSTQELNVCHMPHVNLYACAWVGMGVFMCVSEYLCSAG